MVYSSIPVYVDPPNWQQQPNIHQANGTDTTQLLPPLPPQAGQPPMGVGMGSIRPGSMADRARLAKIPPPEAALKCPRCESTNTKFCYFNNYSLSQPRHFCKTCRRYWTRGGALRNVPVGGGCRRNKKNKRSRSKSPASNAGEKQQQLSNSLSPASAIIPNNSSGNTHELIGQLPHQPPNLPFMSSLHQNMNRYGVVGNIGLSLREIQGQGQMDHHHQQHQHHMGFQIGGNSASVSASAASASGGVDHHHHQWRLQQFPFLNGFDSSSNPSSASYPFQNEGINNESPSSGLVGDIATVGSRVTNTTMQQPPVKMEENGAMNNLSRSHLNNNNNNNNSNNNSVSENNQYYSWTDMSGLASSSTTHHLL